MAILMYLGEPLNLINNTKKKKKVWRDQKPKPGKGKYNKQYDKIKPRKDTKYSTKTDKLCKEETKK